MKRKQNDKKYSRQDSFSSRKSATLAVSPKLVKPAVPAVKSVAIRVSPMPAKVVLPKPPPPAKVELPKLPPPAKVELPKPEKKEEVQDEKEQKEADEACELIKKIRPRLGYVFNCVFK
jgi:hypothetical protein